MKDVLKSWNQNSAFANRVLDKLLTNVSRAELQLLIWTSFLEKKSPNTSKDSHCGSYAYKPAKNKLLMSRACVRP